MRARDTDPPYQKLRDPPASRPRRVCAGITGWLRQWWSKDRSGDTPLRSVADVRVRVATRLKQINLKLNFWETRMTKLKRQAQTYAQQHNEARALGATKLYMHLKQSHQVLVQVQTKLGLLRQEMDKMQTLKQCMDALHDGTQAMDSMLHESMSVQDIDRMMSRWDIQLQQASEIGQAMAQQSDLSNPDALAPVQRHEMEDDDASVLLTQWRVEALETLDAPSESPNVRPLPEHNESKRSKTRGKMAELSHPN